jgi:hypothetical protein
MIFLLVQRQGAAIPPDFHGLPGEKITGLRALGVACELSPVSAPHGRHGPGRRGASDPRQVAFREACCTATSATAGLPLELAKPRHDRSFAGRWRCGGRRWSGRRAMACGGVAANRARHRPLWPDNLPGCSEERCRPRVLPVSTLPCRSGRTAAVQWMRQRQPDLMRSVTNIS